MASMLDFLQVESIVIGLSVSAMQQQLPLLFCKAFCAGESVQRRFNLYKVKRFGLAS